MGREIRKVPKGWQHPKDDKGRFKPLNDEYYGDAVEEWYNNHKLWLEKKHPDQLRDSKLDYKFFAEWGGNAPDIEYYRLEKWSEEEANCFQMYQTVSEGTPVSPVFESLEGLENWLVGEGYSRTAAYEFCKHGYAPSFTMTPQHGIRDGISSYED